MPHTNFRLLAKQLHVGKIIVSLLLVAGLLSLLLEMTDNSAEVWHLVLNARWSWTLGALLYVVASICCAVMVYACLARNIVSFKRSLQVQVAAGFANRLLPAGLGGGGVYTAYLRHQGYELPESVAIVAINDILGFIGSVIWVGLVLLINPSVLRHLTLPTASVSSVVLTIVCVITCSIPFIIWPRFRHKAFGFILSSWQTFKRAFVPSWRQLAALLFAMLLTLMNACALSFCAVAVHASVSVGLAILVLSAGTFVGAAIPTPGGIGGVEVGAAAALIAFGVPENAALATIVLYRLLSFWLPVIPGIFATMQLRRQGMLSFDVSPRSS